VWNKFSLFEGYIKSSVINVGHSQKENETISSTRELSIDLYYINFQFCGCHKNLTNSFRA